MYRRNEKFSVALMKVRRRTEGNIAFKYLLLQEIFLYKLRLKRHHVKF